MASRRAADVARHFAAAVALEDGLTYMEPPDWPIPVRQLQGAALLAVGRARDAERAFREDLVKVCGKGSACVMRQDQRAADEVPASSRRAARLWIVLASVVCASAVMVSVSDGASPGAQTSPRRGDDLTGRQIVLITGSTSGLGREVARRLASTGAHVIVHGRDRDRGMALVEEIEREGKGSARFYAADFASLDQVRAFGAAVLRDYDRLDVLINNAGIWSRNPPGRAVSADGHELRFQVNYLSGFLLTRMLLPRLVASAPSRIVNVSSRAASPIDFDDVMLERDYTGSRAYGQSKLAQVMFTFDLARELQGKGVIVGALHPATLMDTAMILDAGEEPRSTVGEGADAVMHLVTSADLESGQFFSGLRPARAHDQTYDEAARERLRKLSEALTGTK